jgi:hypothetical protein
MVSCNILFRFQFREAEDPHFKFRFLNEKSLNIHKNVLRHDLVICVGNKTHTSKTFRSKIFFFLGAFRTHYALFFHRKII